MRENPAKIIKIGIRSTPSEEMIEEASESDIAHAFFGNKVFIFAIDDGDHIGGDNSYLEIITAVISSMTRNGEGFTFLFEGHTLYNSKAYGDRKITGEIRVVEKKCSGFVEFHFSKNKDENNGLKIEEV
jgi:hypothetical protein